MTEFSFSLVSQSPGSRNGSMDDGTHGFGPHIIKVMDAEMLDRVCQKYEKMGHSVQLNGCILKLNVIKGTTCLQEEINSKFNETMDFTDMMLVSSTGQEIPVHRFVLAARSPVFKRLFSSQVI